MIENFDEKTLNSEVIYSGKVMRIERDSVELATGKCSIREVVRHSGGVVIVAMRNSETILMVKQYRYPIAQTSLELPAGKLEKGENPDFACKRELQEETGFVAKNWESLGYIYTSPGICDEKLYLYKADELTFIVENPDEGEIIQCYEYKISDVFDMIKQGQINDAKTICALTRAFKL